MNRFVVMGSVLATCGLLVTAISMVGTSRDRPDSASSPGASMPAGVGPRSSSSPQRSWSRPLGPHASSAGGRALHEPPEPPEPSLDMLEPEVAEVSAEVESTPMPEQIAAAEARWKDDYITQIDHALATQDVDVEWSQRSTAQLESSFGDLAPNASVEVSKCGATLCRVEITHPDAMGHEDLLAAAQARFPWAGPGVVVSGTSDQGRDTVVYVARPGTKLPTAATKVEDYL